jgi:polyisoprenoid-binding protein YceI
MTVHLGRICLLAAIRRLIRQKTAVTCALIGLVVLPGSTARAELAVWEIDSEHFSIAFEVEHIGYQQQLGMFLEGSGQFRYDPERRMLDSGRIEISADSVFTNLDDRDEHLKGRDFLNVRRYPAIVFQADKLTLDPSSPTTGTLTGTLTMLDTSQPVELLVNINKRERYPFGHRKETLGISASTTINRSQWGMDYGVGNALVGDAVKLRFEFEAIRQ